MSEEPYFLPWGIPDSRFWQTTSGQASLGGHPWATEQNTHYVPHPASPPIASAAVETRHPAYQAPPPQRPAMVEPAPVPSLAPDSAAGDAGDVNGLRAALDEHVAAIQQAITQGRLMDATVMAAHADETMTFTYGPADSGTINIRQMRGYIASQAGDDVTATRWFMTTAQLWDRAVGSGDPLTQNAAGWAAASWHRITHRGQARALAPQLLEVLTAVAGPESATVKEIWRRLSEND